MDKPGGQQNIWGKAVRWDMGQGPGECRSAKEPVRTVDVFGTAAAKEDAEHSVGSTADESSAGGGEFLPALTEQQVIFLAHAPEFREAARCQLVVGVDLQYPGRLTGMAVTGKNSRPMPCICLAVYENLRRSLLVCRQEV